MFGRKRASQAVRLKRILAKFQQLADGDYERLRALVPSSDMWRLFIDGVDQHHKNSVTENLHNTAVLKELFRIRESTISPALIKEISVLNHGWVTYECQERGYLAAMFRAYHYLMSCEDGLSLSLILNVHRHALSNVQHTNYRRYATTDEPGRFRSHHTCQFPITAETASYEGLRELMAEFTPHMSFCVNGMLINRRSIEECRAGVLTENADVFKQRFPHFFEKLLKVQYQHELADFIFNLLNTDEIVVSLISIQTSDTEATLRFYAEKYIAQAVAGLAATTDPLEHMRCIIRFTQRMLHLHMFLDGHGRTFIMLMREYFAKQYKLPMAILHQPMAYTACSVDELVDEHLDGMENVFKLLEKGVLFGVRSEEILRTAALPNSFGVSVSYFHELVDNEEKAREALMMDKSFEQHIRL